MSGRPSSGPSPHELDLISKTPPEYPFLESPQTQSLMFNSLWLSFLIYKMQIKKKKKALRSEGYYED